jgi:hypothetical protein
VTEKDERCDEKHKDREFDAFEHITSWAFPQTIELLKCIYHSGKQYYSALFRLLWFDSPLTKGDKGGCRFFSANTTPCTPFSKGEFSSISAIRGFDKKFDIELVSPA